MWTNVCVLGTNETASSLTSDQSEACHLAHPFRPMQKSGDIGFKKVSVSVLSEKGFKVGVIEHP